MRYWSLLEPEHKLPTLTQSVKNHTRMVDKKMWDSSLIIYSWLRDRNKQKIFGMYQDSPRKIQRLKDWVKVFRGPQLLATYVTHTFCHQQSYCVTSHTNRTKWTVHVESSKWLTLCKSLRLWDGFEMEINDQKISSSKMYRSVKFYKMFVCSLRPIFFIKALRIDRYNLPMWC